MFLPTSDLWVAAFEKSNSRHLLARTKLKITDQDVAIVPVWVVFDVCSNLKLADQSFFLSVIHSTQNVRIYYPDAEDLKRIKLLCEKSKKSFGECANNYLLAHLGCTLLGF